MSISLVSRSESKLLFVLNNYPLEDKQNKTHQLLSLLSENTVSEITILEGAVANAIWGSRGANGVILMTVKDRKTRKKIKQIQKEQIQNKKNE
jgi:TonB-dependent SusC/RagA subfamily outer membrane receptor